MLSYRNEAAFSKALCTAMRAKGIFVQRIESGETGKGIPDLFVITKGTPMWIELKRIHGTCSDKRTLEIPWRPGQQAWLNDVSHRGVICLTLACYDDGILKISHANIWHGNKVPATIISKAIGAVVYYKDIRSLLA